MSKKRKFTTEEASVRLLSSMEVAINNMIDEVRKPVDGELSGSQRKAELQSIKQTEYLITLRTFPRIPLSNLELLQFLLFLGVL